MSAPISPTTDVTPYKGIVLFCTAVFLFAVMDSFAKYAGQTYSPLQVVWARCFFHIVLLILFLGPIHGLNLIRTNNLKIQILRSMLLLGATICIFTAIKYIPLADAGAIAATSPLFVILLSVLLLKEKISLRRWCAVGVGFAGAMIVLRPGLSMVHPAMFLVVLMSLFYALYQLTTRFLSGVDSSVTTAFYSVLVGTIVMSFVMPFVWIMPDLEGWILLAIVGFLGGVSHFIMIVAFKYTAASTVAPFNYTQLIWMAVIGYLAFGNLPDGMTILGAAIIVGSGLYIIHRERQTTRKTDPLVG
ncbi:DMT family transporter [Sneathiella litorea]|uniref:EamA family transporter n=1 Tax=Sneathiella litorea TaxID=2606216 RepID=A0A6L8W7T2_9PROT|nr:DMT family transporter [Sneathiella litorea]MZR30307.1 EamA family transporter [Sneathiella litorea]